MGVPHLSDMPPTFHGGEVTDRSNCVLPHRVDPERPRPALDGAYICHGHRENLRDDITDLPGLHAQLGDQLADATPTRDSNSSGHGSGHTIPLPINMGIVAWREQIERDLIWWAVLVAQQRGISAPGARAPLPVATWLGRHVDWIAADQFAAQHCPPVARELTGRARALLNPSGSKRIEIGPCRQVEGDTICAGTLYATVRADDDPRPSFIYCSTCTFSKEPTEWLRFGKTYGAPRATA